MLSASVHWCSVQIMAVTALTMHPIHNIGLCVDHSSSSVLGHTISRSLQIPHPPKKGYANQLVRGLRINS